MANSPVLKRDDLEEILSQIFTLADECGPSKEEMRSCLDTISDLADPDSELERDNSGNWSVVEPEETGEDEDDPDIEDE
jgi:hypothetical protein